MQTQIAAIYDAASLCIKHKCDKKKRRQGWRRNERKQGRKEPAGQPQCNLEKIHISKNTRQRLLLRRTEQRTTQEIQLQKETQDTDEILNITNLAIVRDQG